MRRCKREEQELRDASGTCRSSRRSRPSTTWWSPRLWRTKVQKKGLSFISDFVFSFAWWWADTVQWIHLCLPSCGPGFESRLSSTSLTLNTYIKNIMFVLVSVSYKLMPLASMVKLSWYLFAMIGGSNPPKWLINWASCQTTFSLWYLYPNKKT